MLLWSWILSVTAAIFVYQLSFNTKFGSWCVSAVSSTLLFFLSITLYITNPFRYLQSTIIPPDGNGLNPLLQNPYMAIHPPMLYLGFTGFAIPYAICLGALLAKEKTDDWGKIARRWTLTAWGFLTIGITLGGHWAYLELGWGGFWAWDPVENASFLPWLTGTAFLHSIMVQERKDVLKTWNIWLAIITYSLTVLGTFLTRSGVVQSIHAFAEADIGWVFLTYLGLVLGSGLVLTFLSRSELISKRKIESILSREAAFLVNNLILLSICFAILWGVLFPVFSEALTGVRQTVGVPFFNAISVPLFLFLVFLMGFGPMLAWRNTSFSQLKRTFITPFVSALIVAVILVWAGVQGFYPILSYALCWFVIATILFELYRAAKIQHASGIVPSEALANVIKRHPNKYGGYLVHFGVVIAVLAITASMAHKVEKDFSLSLNEIYKIGRFQLELKDLAPVDEPNYAGVRASVDLLSSTGEHLDTLSPELRRYRRNDESTTEVALRMGPREDVYLVLAGLNDEGTSAAFKVFINPLQIWLWIGVMIMAIGTIVVLIPGKSAAAITDDV